ncbi:MAG: hypothetical protein M3P06_14640 [Acidobacteriota bacterium]|nr:hypothetical protein [Acidobacteriota bacterium]
MRFKSTVVLLLIVVVGTTTFPVTGQEEPLPAIHAKGTVLPLTPSIVLPAEPVAVSIPLPTLEDRARANDFVTFDALYRDAVRRGDSVAPFAPLHALWTYGITDPTGAFYDRAIYDRLARAYPSYETFIAEHRIADSNGNVFYPTSETRTFLLDRALDGTVPSVQLADLGRSTQSTELRTESTAKSVWERSTAATQRSAVAQRSTATPRRSSAAAAPRTAPRSTAARSSTSPRRSTSTPKRSAAASGTPASSPAGNAASRRVAAPVAATPEPKAPARETSTALSTGSGAAPVVAEKAPVVVDQAPVVAEPTTSVEPPVVVRAEEPPAAVDTAVTAPQPIVADNNFGARGLLLLVIGLLGAGLLAMLLRAPREAPPSIMHPPNVVPPPTGDNPSGPTPVEPLRRPSAAPEPPPPGKNRAGGSHG